MSKHLRILDHFELVTLACVSQPERLRVSIIKKILRRAESIPMPFISSRLYHSAQLPSPAPQEQFPPPTLTARRKANFHSPLIPFASTDVLQSLVLRNEHSAFPLYILLRIRSRPNTSISLCPFFLCYHRKTVPLTFRRLLERRHSAPMPRDGAQARATELENDASRCARPPLVEVSRISQGHRVPGTRDRVSRSLRALRERPVAPR